MRTKALILLSSAALGVAACGQKTDNANTDTNVDTNVLTANDVLATTPPSASPMTSQGFVNAAAASDRFEIESSKLAATAAQSAAVKSFAQKMISAHTDSTAKLKSTLAGMTPPVTPDDTLSAEQQKTLDSLKPLTGAAFDSAYASAQVDAHQKALDALNGYAAGGDNAQLKTFASGLVPTVTAHLNMAKGLK